MYESYFKFEKPPFKVVPDPSMLFASHSVREAMTRLEFAIRTGKGITVMTGEVGTGKTTLVNRFLDKASAETQTAYIFNPTLSGLQLLKTLAEELGLQTYGMAKVDLTRGLYELLLRNRAAGRRTVVFVDEAQSLSREALEELRLISNLETWQDKLLNIILVGQPELLEKLESFNLRQLRQRVELFIQIEAMTAVETRQYIEHRLRVANPLREVSFSDAACQLIHGVTGGVPRTINIVCDASLLVAFVAESSQVSASMVREAARTIDAQQVSLRLGRRRRAGLWQKITAGLAAAVVLGGLFSTLDSRIQRRPRLQPVTPYSPAPAQPTVQTAGDSGGDTGVVTAILVHVASFRSREQAESYAARLAGLESRRVYLQSTSESGEAWHRVMVGDFASVDEATGFAHAAQQAGKLEYAKAVQVRRAGLEAWKADSRVQ